MFIVEMCASVGRRRGSTERRGAHESKKKKNGAKKEQGPSCRDILFPLDACAHGECHLATSHRRRSSDLASPFYSVARIMGTAFAHVERRGKMVIMYKTRRTTPQPTHHRNNTG